MRESNPPPSGRQPDVQTAAPTGPVGSGGIRTPKALSRPGFTDRCDSPSSPRSQETVRVGLEPTRPSQGGRFSRPLSTPAAILTPFSDQQKTHCHPMTVGWSFFDLKSEGTSVRRSSSSSPRAMVIIAAIERATGQPAIGIRPTHRRDKTAGKRRSLDEQVPGCSRS